MGIVYKRTFSFAFMPISYFALDYNYSNQPSVKKENLYHVKNCHYWGGQFDLLPAARC